MVIAEIESKKINCPIDGGKSLFLYFAIIVVNITCFTCGIAFAWSSPVSPKLGSTSENPLGVLLSEDEISWLASLMSLGACVGPFFGGYLADKIGRKQTFIASTIPNILVYILLAFAHNLYVYYVARFIKGICLGIFLTVVPMYVGEIAEVRNRGIFGCFTVFFVTIGSLYSFVVGPYISLEWFNLSCIAGPILFLIIVTPFIPESPCYLIMKGKHEAARISLTKLRCGQIEDEFLDMTTTVKECMATQGGISDILKTKHLYKALRMSIALMVIQQLTAISVIVFYMQLIFEDSGSSLSSDVSTIIIGTVQVVGTFASTIIVEKLGRKPLLIISTATTSIMLTVLSIYFYLLNKTDLSSISWLPIMTLMIYMLSYNVGIGPLSFAVMGEIFPPQVKSVASSLSVSSCYLCSFGATKVFPILASSLGTWFGFLLFAIGNALGVAFIYRFMPETKGRTLTEILDYFK